MSNACVNIEFPLCLNVEGNSVNKVRCNPVPEQKFKSHMVLSWSVRLECS